MAMPLKDVHGRLHDVKLISPDGSSRRAATDTETPPLMHLIDPGRRVREDAVIVAGDYLSGAAIHRATRLPVAVADEPEKTMDVARALRERYPDSKLIIAADREQAQALMETAGEIRAALATLPGKTKSFAKMAGEPDSIRDVLARPAGDAVWLRWREAEPVEKDSGDSPQSLLRDSRWRTCDRTRTAVFLFPWPMPAGACGACTRSTRMEKRPSAWRREAPRD